jgi:hypothetical protein
MCLEKIEYKEKEYKVKYIHQRRWSEPTKEELLNGIYYHIKPKGGRTIAFIGDEEKPIEYGLAECSEKDVYNKTLGRTIATGRLLKRLGLNTKLALE